MPYDALCNYLVDKYGAAKYDYYTSPECTTKNKLVFRVKEGLFCHHRDEDKGEDLSNDVGAKIQPFEWQRKERLVYCNILEHLILHIKIAVMGQKDILKTPNEVRAFFTPGIFFICHDINDMFLYTDTHAAKYKKGYRAIKDNYEDYLTLLNALLKYIENVYLGDKTAPAFLRLGAVIHCPLGDCKIIDYTEDGKRFIIKTSADETDECSIHYAYDQFTFRDYIEEAVENFAQGEYAFNRKIFDDITNCQQTDDIEKWANLLKIDFIGHK